MKIILRSLVFILSACLLPNASYGQVAGEELVAQIADKIQIHYFYLSTCPYCKQQEPVLSKLRHKTGIAIRPMSLDGKPMQLSSNGQEIPFYDGRQVASHYGLFQTPTLLVYEPPGVYAILSQGYIGYEDLVAYLVAYGEQRNLFSNSR